MRDKESTLIVKDITETSQFGLKQITSVSHKYAVLQQFLDGIRELAHLHMWWILFSITSQSSYAYDTTWVGYS